MSDFNVDANAYCEGCDTPHIQRIAVVPVSGLPVPDNKLVFVSLLQ
jgi:hypothetical protein